MPSSRPELKTLTSLRYFAALHVVLQHVAPISFGFAFLALPAPMQNFLFNGYAAVPFFFSLSGFVLFYSYENTPATPSRFWAKRYARLAPAFYLGLLIGFPLFWIGLRHEPLAPLKAVAYLLANLGFVQTLVPGSLLIDRPSWSLTAEALFYFGFPFLLPLAKNWNKTGAAIALVLAFLFSAAPQWLGYRLIAPTGWPVNLYLLNPGAAAILQNNPFTHCGEFVFGIAVAKLWRLRARGSGDALLALGAVLYLGITCAGFMPINFLGSFAPLPACALLLWGAAGPRGRYTRWLESPILVVLGHASYALYILHDPLKDYFLYARDSYPNSSGALWILGFLAGTSLLAVLCFKAFETPARRWIEKKLL